MAEPISLASGLLALAAFALQSSKSLYQAVESFQNNPKTIRELKEELEALGGVLQSLQGVAVNSNADLTALELPLFRCGKACRDLEVLINKCTTHSGGSRTSFRDWAKLKYMGDNIVEFRNMLAGYKSTINIALGGANFRTVTVTANVLEEYKEMVTNTISDLEERLREMDNKLQNPSFQGTGTSDEEAAERERIEEERDSIKQCLRICAEISEHIDQAQLNVPENAFTASNAHQAVMKMLGDHIPATADTLKECKERLIRRKFKLEERLQEIDSRLQTFSSMAERDQIQEEKESIKSCLGICGQGSEQADQVRTCFFEDISAARDACQVIATTVGDLISATRVTAEAKSTQLLGQMADATLQQFSRDRGHVAIEKAMGPENGMVEKFEDQYGLGHKLRSAL